MSEQEIFEQLKEIFKLANSASELPENISLSSDLRTDLGLTSIGVLYLIISIEAKFEIQFDDVSFNDFAVVGDIVNYIKNKMDKEN